MKTYITPESIPGAGSCVQLRESGDLFIQSFDAYGFQRELILKCSDSPTSGYRLHVYQHPGRREERTLTVNAGRKLMAALLACCESATRRTLLFNAGNADAPKNSGFVRFQEACFRGNDSALLIEML